MADEMLRIAGRSSSGVAKAIQTDDYGNLGVQTVGRNSDIVTIADNSPLNGTKLTFSADMFNDILYTITGAAHIWTQNKIEGYMQSSRPNDGGAGSSSVLTFDGIGIKTDIDFKVSMQTTYGQDAYASPAWRIVDELNCYYIHLATGQLRKMVGGVNTTLYTGTPINMRTTSKEFQIRMIGNEITVFVDGVLWGSAIDSQFTTGKVGVRPFLYPLSEVRYFSFEFYEKFTEQTKGQPFNIKPYSNWTLFLKTSGAIEISIELSPDGVNWYKATDTLVFDTADDMIIEFGYIAKYIRLTGNNLALITAQILGGV